MQRLLNTLTLLTIAVVLAGCQTTPPTPVPPAKPVVNKPVADAMRVVTWNVEHLAYPMDTGCRPRTAEEIAGLKAYTAGLDADIVGLQEVGSEAAIRQLFPEDECQVIMSARPDSEPFECRQNGFTSTQQRVAFAVRKDIPVLKVTHHDEFMLDRPGLRFGIAITVNTPLGETEILNLHMKSGCFIDNFTRGDSEACQVFSRQVPHLEKLVAEYEASGKPYLLIGDFNHRITAHYNRLTQILKGAAPSLHVATEDMIGCHPWYPAPIDNVVVGNTNPTPIAKTAQAIDFKDMAVDNMLSDHCAVAVDLQNVNEFLSQPLKWVKNSKEFELLTLGIYARAEQSLDSLSLPESNWVVVMDIDETVLDNSDYEKLMIARATSFAPDTWGEWVSSEQATLVPGVKSFIEKVFSKGGKIAFVTNRMRERDDHTWNNMLAVGLGITEQNSCLMGRNQDDVASVENGTYVNDKDLRRKQIREGTAGCYTLSEVHSDWRAEHSIVMQVGDNIKDIEGVTQASAVPEELLKRLDKDIIVLMNPVYGSW